MRRRDLAKRLVAAVNDTERQQLLERHARSIGTALAREIKDISYSSWTTEPVVAQRASDALRFVVRLDPDNEIAAISAWVTGIAEITKGRFEKAIENLDSAAELFAQGDIVVDGAQTQVAKLIALAHLGRYDEANRVGRRALKIFERAGDKLAAAKIELNLSNVAARRERHREAERFALSALRRFKSLGEKTWQTLAENDLANTYSEINDFRKAEKYFSMAAKSARSARMLVTEAEIEASMGNLALFRARYGDALRLLELSRQKYDQLGMPHQTVIAELEIAEIYAELNLLSEASAMLETIVERLKELGLRAEEARGRLTNARVMFLQGKLAGAKKELSRARQLYTHEKNSVGIARTTLLTAGIETRLKNYGRAVRMSEEAIDLLKHLGNKRLSVAALLLKAEAERGLGQAALSRRLLNKTIDEALENDHLNIAAAALNSLGKMALTKGDKQTAGSHFLRAIKLIEGQRAPIASDELRMSFLAGQLDPYQELFKIALDDGRYEYAFSFNEASRARSLSDVMQSSVDSPSSGTLGRELDRIREELNWFYSRLSRDPAGDEVSEIEKEISARERQISKVNRQIESTAKRARSRPEFDLNRFQSELGDDTSFIEYVGEDGSIGAFVIKGDDLTFVANLGTEVEVKRLLEGLRFQFATFRFGTAALRGFASQLRSSADRYLKELYSLLFARIEPLVAGRKVVIAPIGVLNYIPFNALFDGDKYLIEKSELSIVPSAAVWSSVARKRIKPNGKILLMGYSDQSIPLAEDEVRKLKNIYRRNASLFAGKKATFGAFVENASKADIIHLACHGQFRSDNPMFSSLHLADGWITVRDLGRQRLRASLVTLSACETGLNEIYAGEEVLGLTRGFLSAGARNLIVSLWTVNDGATAEIMTSLHKHLLVKYSPAASLRAAQIESIHRGMHPYFWSPFISIGV